MDSLRNKLGAAALAALVTATVSAGDPVGNTAPECKLSALGEGPAVDIRQFKGKVVYLDFWASWCTTCVKSFPFMNELTHEFGDKGLQVLGINVDEKPENAKAFLTKHPAHFANGADRSGACPKSFDVRAMPATYLIDRRGVVRFKHFGFKSEQTDEVRAQIAKLLAEPA